MEQSIEKKRMSFSDYLRLWFKWLLDPLAVFFNRLGIHPNVMTLLGLFGTTIGALLIAKGSLTWGGIFILFTVPFDALDGTMARLRGEASNWGAFVDSVTDRYSELFVYAGLLIYYLNQGDKLACTLVYLAAAGTVLVSYTKAKADSLNFDANVGLLTRAERYLVLAPLLVLNMPIIALWILAILANFTALQRIMRVRHQAHHPQAKGE
ncbi:MAG: CDP-alcohol phosphatidyltransferase family protein [Chloroflexota bacterium]